MEIQTSIRRGGLSFPHPRLVKISTPYAKSGILFEDFKRSWGADDPDRLVWKASSLLMNPGLTSARLERERRLDPDRFAREYEAEFAEDLSAFLPGEWIDSAVMAGRYELPPKKQIQYVAAVDPSGGSGRDAFTLAILHVEGRGENKRLVHDVSRGWKRSGIDKIDLEGVVAECSAILKSYGCKQVVGDRYSAQWVQQAFRRCSIEYVESQLSKSDAYLETHPLFAQGAIDILDDSTLVRELKLLEARPRAGGRTQVDHPSGGRFHDDYANALCLAAATTITAEPTHAPCFIIDDVPY